MSMLSGGGSDDENHSPNDFRIGSFKDRGILP
jgi:hypothetical protein